MVENDLRIQNGPSLAARCLGHAAVVWVPVVLGAREVPRLAGSKADHQHLRWKGNFCSALGWLHLHIWGTVQYKWSRVSLTQEQRHMQVEVIEVTHLERLILLIGILPLDSCLFDDSGTIPTFLIQYLVSPQAAVNFQATRSKYATNMQIFRHFRQRISINILQHGGFLKWWYL
jgi:hypothetical protein